MKECICEAESLYFTEKKESRRRVSGDGGVGGVWEGRARWVGYGQMGGPAGWAEREQVGGDNSVGGREQVGRDSGVGGV